MVLNNSLFVPPIVACSSVLAAGSTLLVGELSGCNKEPDVVVVTAGSAVAINATTISLSVTTPAADGVMPVYKGKVLYFGTTPIVFTQDGVITNTAASFPIQPATGAVAASATTSAFALYPLLSTTDMPLTYSDTTQDSTDHAGGLQGAMVKTNYEIQSAVSGRVRCDDIALNKEIYVVYALGDLASCGTLSYGTAILSAYSETNTVKDFIKYSFNLLWQPVTSVIKRKADLTPAQTTEFDLARRYLGIPDRP
jgi:hypothetical protein